MYKLDIVHKLPKVSNIHNFLSMPPPPPASSTYAQAGRFCLSSAPKQNRKIVAIILYKDISVQLAMAGSESSVVYKLSNCHPFFLVLSPMKMFCFGSESSVRA